MSSPIVTASPSNVSQRSGAVILLRKQPGTSSFRALGPLKREMGTKKIGHTGTLDPFAEGLLVALSGYATKLAPFFDGLDKTYQATARFGVATDTLDPEGITTGTGPIPDEADILSALDDFSGPIEQTPPVYSAIKIGGKRAYRLARSGQEVSLQPRRVTIHRFELSSYTPPNATFFMHVSKGTYVRSLVRDLATSLGTGAYVGSLFRTSVGPFSLHEVAAGEVALCIEPAAALERLGVPIVVAEGDSVDRIAHGGELAKVRLEPQPGKDGTHAVVDAAGILRAIIERNHGQLSYRFVSPEEPKTRID